MDELPATRRDLNAKAVRALCRAGLWHGSTAGAAPGFVQANLVILPRESAAEFRVFCERNARACPLIEVLEPGAVHPRCAPGADLRTDVPLYRIYRDGLLAGEVGELTALWQDDWVTFLIGCSFSFESALIAEGIALRHIDQRLNVAMYHTNRPCEPAGRFHGNLVVSMRPVAKRLVARAIEVSARFPQGHGAPVHVGEPEQLGIADLSRPDFGDAVAIQPDELPVFWACGVTPQAVLQTSRIALCVTHAPGRMFVTDLAA